MATGKYPRLGLVYPLADVMPPDHVLLERVHAQFAAHGVVSV